VLVQTLRRHQVLGGQYRHGHGQVKAGAFLAGVGGGQIQGDAVGREAVARTLDGGPDPVLGLLHRGIRQPHRGEGRQPLGQENLHLHDVGVHAPERAAFDSG
jgi:hypothetical protein